MARKPESELLGLFGIKERCSLNFRTTWKAASITFHGLRQTEKSSATFTKTLTYSTHNTTMEKLGKKEIELLEKYTNWLCDNRYTDSDVYAEEPTAIDG